MAQSEGTLRGMVLTEQGQTGDLNLTPLAGAMVDAAPYGMLLLDEQAGVHYLNHCAFELLSLGAEFSGMGSEPLQSEFNQRCRELIAALKTTAAANARACRLISLRSRGSRILAEICIAPLPAQPAMYCATLRRVETQAADIGSDSTRMLLLERFVDEHPSMLVVRDGEGRIIMCNNKLAQYYGHSAQEMTGMLHQDLWRKIGIDEARIAEWIEEDRVLLEKGGSMDYIQEYQHVNRERRWYHNQKTVVHLADATPCVLVTYADITARKQIEEALAASEQRLRAVFEMAAVGIAVVDCEAGFLQANSLFQQMIGYSEAELLQQNAFGFTPPQDWDKTRPLFEGLRSGEIESCSVEMRFVRRDGSIIWMDVWATPLFDNAGRIEALLGVFVDATQRRRHVAERERLIAELSQALMTVKTLSGLVPICSSCKKVRDDRGFWNQLEEYLGRHSDARLSHGLCPDCAEEICPEISKES